VHLVRILVVVAVALTFLPLAHAADATLPGENGDLLVWSVESVGVESPGLEGLYTVDPMTLELSKLPVDSSGFSDVAWSPDGTQIAFSRARPSLAPEDALWIMDADGSNQRLVLEANPDEDFRRLAWSPDGRRIIVATERHFSVPGGPSNSLVIVDLAGTMLREIQFGPTGRDLVTSLEWSPDGRSVLLGLFGYPTDVATTVAVFDLESLVLTPLANGYDPDWSPDGSSIAFVHRQDGESAADERATTAVMNADGTSLREYPILTGTWTGPDSQRAGFNPTWSPDGRQIAYEIMHHHFEIMDADGSNRHAYDFAFSSIKDLQWQPIRGTSGFVDVPDAHTFAGDVAWMRDAGITKGCNPPANSLYCPDGLVTRGQMAAFLTRTLDLPTATRDWFNDDNDSVFEGDINRLAEAGITRGCNPPVSDRYCPEGKITREQMAAFLVRALGYTDDGGGDLFIDDDDSIFEADIDRLGTAGVTKGCNPPTNDRYCPTNNVTRGQMAAFLHRALG